MIKENESTRIIYDAFSKEAHANGGYAISWHLTQILGYRYPTQKINYELDKFVKWGILKKEVQKGHTKYIKP